MLRNIFTKFMQIVQTILNSSVLIEVKSKYEIRIKARDFKFVVK